MKPKHFLSALATLAAILLAFATLALAAATYYGPQRAEERRYELAHPRAVVRHPSASASGH